MVAYRPYRLYRVPTLPNPGLNIDQKFMRSNVIHNYLEPFNLKMLLEDCFMRYCAQLKLKFSYNLE